MTADTASALPLPSMAPNSTSRIDAEPEPTDEELEALANDPDAKWCTVEEVIARLREIDACTS